MPLNPKPHCIGYANMHIATSQDYKCTQKTLGISMLKNIFLLHTNIYNNFPLKYTPVQVRILVKGTIFSYRNQGS
jgi:hypothetical protein